MHFPKAAKEAVEKAQTSSPESVTTVAKQVTRRPSAGRKVEERLKEAKAAARAAKETVEVAGVEKEAPRKRRVTSAA